MGQVLPSSKLLPVTMVAIAVTIGLKTALLVTSAPSLDSMQAGVAQGLMLASATAGSSVIGQARAAAAESPAANAAKPAQATQMPPPVAAAQSQSPPSPVAAPSIPVAAGDSGSDPLLNRRSQLEDHEREVSRREVALTVVEKRLDERVAELVALQARLQALQTGLKERDEANWAGLVKIYEGMRPREAAAIFNSLERPVLLEIVDRMQPTKAALVLASMDAEKARQVTADLAARRTKSVTVMN